MGLTLFFLTIGASCSLSQAQSDGKATGEKHLKDSLRALLALKTIECDIRMETQVDGTEYASRGRYEEQVLPKPLAGNFLRSIYRLEVYFSTVDTPTASGSDPNRMTLVCHISDDPTKSQIGKYTSIEGVKTFSTIDVSRLEERLKQADSEQFFAQISEVRNLGGLAGTFRQIDRFYEFIAPVQQENLQGDEQVPAWKITGSLRKVYYKDMLQRFGGLDKKGRHPADLPTDVEIWIGRHNDFPYKVRYLNRQTEKSEQKTLLFQESFFNVILNGEPIPVSKFAPLKVPEGVFSVQDDTDNFLRSLGL
jgi:hypothetical protein